MKIKQGTFIDIDVDFRNDGSLELSQDDGGYDHDKDKLIIDKIGAEKLIEELRKYIAE